jgi:hypothetical protein
MLDPFAFMDTIASVEIIMLGIPFPGSELYLRSISPDSLMLSSMDDSASISFQTLYEFDWPHTSEATIGVKDELLRSTFDTLDEHAEAVIALDDGLYSDSNIEYAYFELLYESDGETRFIHISVGGFINLPVGSQWYYFIGVDCLNM